MTISLFFLNLVRLLKWGFLFHKGRSLSATCHFPSIGGVSRRNKQKTNNLSGLSPRASYTARATAAFLAKLVPTFADRGYHVVSLTDSYGHILDFLDRSRYFFFQAAPQLYSQGWVDPVPDPLLLRESGSAANRASTSGSVARNSDY
jgi:hypothetical protein